MLNVDTHILLFILSGNLTAREAACLAREPLGISAMVLWEITKLHQLGRIASGLGDAAMQDLIGDMTIWPINSDVCRATLMLDFRSDPADELIAATSLAHGVPLVTRDKKILRSKIVPLIRA